MHVTTATINGNPNIGLYGYATDSYCILGPDAAPLKKLAEELLGVPVTITSIAGTSLVGAFCIGTDKKILVPGITFEHEIKKLEEAGLQVETLETVHTALGNNAIVTSKGALVGPMFNAKECAEIEEKLGVPVAQKNLADIEVIGSAIAANTKGALVHKDATKFESSMIKDTLGVPGTTGTVNMGSPYVRAGIITNSNGFIIGNMSGGPEITNADEALGFIEK